MASGIHDFAAIIACAVGAFDRSLTLALVANVYGAGFGQVVWAAFCRPLIAKLAESDSQILDLDAETGG